MKKIFYPAIFHKAEEGGYWITFPDVPECVTEGNDMEEAYHMAVEALGLALTERMREGERLPEVSKIEDIEEGKIVIVQFDLCEYDKKHNSKAEKI